MINKNIGPKENEAEPISPEPNKTAEIVEPENISMFYGLSDTAKEVFSSVYEGASAGLKTIGADKLFNKIGIAYNQFWIDRKTDKAVQLKNEMDSLNSELAQNPGMDPSDKNKIENKKDKLQSRIEKRENRIRLYMNKRDNLAEKFVLSYENKLIPLEANLVALEQERARKEIVCVSTEIKIEEINDQINAKKAELSERYECLANLEDKKEKKEMLEEIKALKEELDGYFGEIKIAKSTISATRDDINKRIHRLNKKTEPYRLKKDKYARLKSVRMQDIGINERAEAIEFMSREKTENHNRIKNMSPYEYADFTEDKPELIENKNTYLEKKEELATAVFKYNEFVEKKNLTKLAIEGESFAEMCSLGSQDNLSLKNFQKLLVEYYKINKITTTEYLEVVKEFKF